MAIKKKTLALSILLTLILIIVLAQRSPVQVEYSVPMDLYVANHTGVNVDTDKLYFGVVDASNSNIVTRQVILKNQGDARWFHTKFVGDLKDYSQAIPNKFYLEEEEEFNVTVEVDPYNLEEGRYGGMFYIYTK